jgi:hypothetical protein
MKAVTKHAASVFALGFLMLVLSSPAGAQTPEAGRAQTGPPDVALGPTGATYHLIFNTQGSGYLVTNPNPLPAIVTLSQHGQLTLIFDGTPTPPPTIYLFSLAFQTAYGGSGNVFVEVSAPPSPGGAAVLVPGGSVSSSFPNFILTFADMGTYTLQVGVDPSALITFKVVVLPAAAGYTTYAGSWDPLAFYPLNTIVSTSSGLTDLDFWIEANNNGTQTQPVQGANDWYHMSGPASGGPTGPQGPQGPAGPIGPAGATGPQGPPGPAGATGAQGPAGTTGLTGPAGPQGLAGPMGLMGATGPQGAMGPMGLQGLAGPGLVSGSVLTLPAHQNPPLGFTLLGASTLIYFDASNHFKTLAVKFYQMQ